MQKYCEIIESINNEIKSRWETYNNFKVCVSQQNNSMTELENRLQSKIPRCNQIAYNIYTRVNDEANFAMNENVKGIDNRFVYATYEDNSVSVVFQTESGAVSAVVFTIISSAEFPDIAEKVTVECANGIENIDDVMAFSLQENENANIDTIWLPLPKKQKRQENMLVCPICKSRHMLSIEGRCIKNNNYGKSVACYKCDYSGPIYYSRDEALDRFCGSDDTVLTKPSDYSKAIKKFEKSNTFKLASDEILNRMLSDTNKLISFTKNKKMSISGNDVAHINSQIKSMVETVEAAYSEIKGEK